MMSRLSKSCRCKIWDHLNTFSCWFLGNRDPKVEAAAGARRPHFGRAAEGAAPQPTDKEPTQDELHQAEAQSDSEVYVSHGSLQGIQPNILKNWFWTFPKCMP